VTTFVGAYGEAADTLRDRIEEMSEGLPGSFAGSIDNTISSVGPMIRAIAGMIDAPDPMISEQGNFSNLNDKVEESERYTTTAINKIGDLGAQWDADLTRREAIACGFDNGSPDADRILNKFCVKDPAAQLQDMATWLKDRKQGYKLGIVAKADPYVTNLAPEMAERFKRDFVKLHAPVLADERERKGKIIEAALTVASLTSRVKRSIADPARLAEIRNRKAKHSAAERDFLAAITRKPDAA
jgi:hypothetical protein